MHIISRRKLNEFAELYPESRNALARWYQVFKRFDFNNFAEVRSQFGSADQAGKFTVFNIGGNKFRLITAIHYNRKKVYIRAVLTHVEYDLGNWKER